MKRVRKNNLEIVARSSLKKRNEEGNTNYSVSIPLDLIIEILTKLPPKSLAKFILVSKLWNPTIRGKHFNDLFMTRSLTRPCFLIAFRWNETSWFFHTASHEAPSSFRQNSTISTTLNKDYQFFQPIRGLICGQNGTKLVICNPSTGQVVDLPKVRTWRKFISTFLGYDSVEDVYKVLCMTVKNVSSDHPPVVSEEHQVLTLRGQKKKWRMIQCQQPHCPVTKGLFMNEIVYYGAWSNSYQVRSFLVGFDVRLEEFSHVNLPKDINIRHGRSEFVDYTGKIGLVDQPLCDQHHIWVLEDVEKQEWSKIFIVVPSWRNLASHYIVRCVGTICTGKLIFAPTYPLYPPHPLFIVYYDLKEDKARRVEIEGIGDQFTAGRIVFLDHVENPMFL